MPEITRRRTGEMLRALFEVLMPVPEGMQARDIPCRPRETFDTVASRSGQLRDRR